MNTTKAREDRIELDLGKLFQYYLKHWKSILTSGLVLALISFLITFCMITPLYRSSVTVYVNNTKNVQMQELTGSNLSAAIHLVKSYVNIIESKPILEDVIRKGELDYEINELRKMISAEQIDETEMFTFSVIHPDAEMAANIANTLADVAPSKIAEIVEGSSAKIVEYAEAAEEPYTPSYKRNIVLGGILGCILMGIFLTLRYLFDMRLQDAEDMAMYFDAPVLGLIPDFAQEAKKKRKGHDAYGYAEGSEGGRNA